MIPRNKASAATSPGGSASNQERHSPKQPASVFREYPRLARLMHGHPKTAIFRSFTELSLTNLLRMQSGLHSLEEQLYYLQRHERECEHSIRATRRDRSQAWKISSAVEDALLRMTKLRGFQKPSPRDFESLGNWFQLPDGRDYFLVPPEHNIWDSNHFDHIYLLDTEQRDKFTEFMYGGILTLFHQIWGRREQKGPSKSLRDYDDKMITQLSDALSAVVSSLLPTLAILVLYFMKPLLIKIVLVVVFTGVFSCLLSIFTEDRRIEIFSATAAFAAVVVVFVSNGAPGDGSKS